MRTSGIAAVTMVAALVVLATGCRDRVETLPVPPPAPVAVHNKIQTDVAAKTITMEGRFCLKEGILDYFAVEATGHEYESVLALEVKPSLLHASLIAVGAEPGLTSEILARLKQNPPPGDNVPEKGGSRFAVTVEWEQDGKAVSVSATQLLINRKTQQPPEDAAWVFTGSYFAKNPETDEHVYMADMDQDLMAVFWSKSAVMNFEKDNGNAYDGMATGYAVNSGVVPAPGTACKVILKMLADK